MNVGLFFIFVCMILFILFRGYSLLKEQKRIRKRFNETKIDNTDLNALLQEAINLYKKEKK